MSSPTPGQQKPKNKDKKSQEVMQLQHKLEALMRQNLELQTTVSKLNDKATIMKQMQISHDLITKQQTQKMLLQIDKLQTFIMAKDDHIQKLAKKKDEIQIENGCLNYQIEKLKKQIQEYKIAAKQQYDELKRYTQTEIRRYEILVNEYQTAINERLQYLTLNQSLQQQIKSTKEEQLKKIADKDREKLQTIDFLKKEMHQKAKQLKSNLLSMRRDQMATNTRLTVLQNQQLIEQLQYQSKHTEKVIKHNTELEKKVQWLNKQLQVEKETVQELAKRGTIAKKIIKTLNQKNSTLQKSIQEIAKTENPKKSFKQSKLSPKKESASKDPSTVQQTIKSMSKTITLLEKELLQYQKKINKIEQQKAHFKQLYELNQPKYQYYLKHEADLRLLMIRFLSFAYQGQLVGQQGEIQYDISRLKDLPVDDWAQSDIQITVKMLLTFVKPHFSMKYLQTDYLKHKNNQISNSDSLEQLLQNQLKQPQIQPSSNNNIRNKLNHSKTKSFSSFNLNTSLNHTIVKINASANVSPDKNSKDMSLHSALQAFKRKSLLRKDKTRSHHNLSQPNMITAEILKCKQTNDTKQNLIQNHDFKPQQFKKDKQASKLNKTNIRDWGKKVQLNYRGAFMLKPK